MIAIEVQIDAQALDAIARGADGGMRDAESTLDQLISFCGDRIEEADVLAMFGLTSEILAQHIINYLRRLPEDMIRVARCLGPS